MISVIVPVYNTEEYLHRCVDSILAQTFTDFELLLINDGSKDSSGAICDEYAVKDSRVRVFHKENTGVSATRNIGIDNSKGDYVIFCDSDDYWCEITALEFLYKKSVENDLDIIRGEYKAVDGFDNDLFIRPITKSKENIANNVINNIIFLKEAINGEYFFVLCLMKKSVLSDIRYNVKRSFLEDMELISRLMLKQMRCMYTPLRFYAYRKITSSVSNTPRIKNLSDSFSMCDVFHELSIKQKDSMIKDFFESHGGLTEDMQERMEIMMYNWTLDTLSLDSYFVHRKEIIERFDLKELQKKVYRWAKDTNYKYPLIIKVSPIIGVWMFRIRHKIGALIKFLKEKCFI